jgi:uncharacterized protein YjgD (DUF1641 family)
MAEELDPETPISDAQVLDEILDTLDLLVERLEALEKKVGAGGGGGGAPDAFVADQLVAIEKKLDAITGAAPAAGPAPAAAADAPTGGPEAIEALDRKVDAIFAATVRRKEATEVVADPLQARLADPEVTAGLARILDRIDALETTARTLETLTERAPILVDGAARTLDLFMMEAEKRGVDPFARGEQGIEVLEKASRPENLTLVSELLDHAPAARFAALAGSKAVDAIEDQDAVADGLARLAGKGAPVLTSSAIDKLLESDLFEPEKLERSVDALTRLLEVATTPEFQKLLDSGLLDPKVLGTAGNATTALVEARQGSIDKVGLFGTLGKLGDPDVQKATGFLFAVAKAFGQKL